MIEHGMNSLCLRCWASTDIRTRSGPPPEGRNRLQSAPSSPALQIHNGGKTITKIVALARDDARWLPAYTVGEAATYLRLPLATIRSWAEGRSYPTRGGTRKPKPVLQLPSPRPPMLSFVNLIEAHVLAAITRDHKIPLQTARRAMDFLGRWLDSDHPLIERSLETDRRDLFVREAGGQRAMREVLDLYLSRIEWDEAGLASRLYPFTGKAEPDAARSVVIDPRLAFSKAVLAGTSVPTQVIAERFKAGESPDCLADDYGRGPSEILEAIRCEFKLAA